VTATGSAAPCALAFGVGLAASLVLTPLAGRAARWTGAVDHPSRRKVHDRALPRLGGLAVFAAFWAAVVAARAGGAPPADGDTWSLVAFGAGSLILVIVGVYDDHVDAPTWMRLVFQIAVGHLAYLAGFRFLLVTHLLDAVAPQPLLAGLAYALTVLWVVGVTNAMNLMDGLDFLCAGTALAATVGLALVGLTSGHGAHVLEYAALIGALIGFGAYNVTPATIFLGDSGSTFLGFFLACFTVRQAQLGDAASASAWIPVVLLAVPVGDTLYAVARRLYLGVSPLSGDRGHVHHRLVAVGHTPGRAVLLLIGATLVASVMSVVLCRARPPASQAALGVVAAMIASAAWRLRLLDPAVIRAGRSHETLRDVHASESRSE
jgi:UDP-GlcNAc:undecaprenyl-phosphate GlcNAc-1-phosphate transferase